ncbi:MAG: histidine phosphatase family protein [Actinomycetes bacterium]
MVIWRHGRTAWNAERRFQGHQDVPLDEVGHTQAKLAAKTLATLDPYAIVSSDLQRARSTAQALADDTGLPVAVDSDLRETFAGSWEGLDRADLQRLHGEDLAAWAAGSDLAPGGGERRSVVARRMMVAIDDALRPVPAGGVLVVVTHGGSARAAIGTMLGLPVAYWPMLGVLTNCAWCVLVENTTRPPGVEVWPQWRLLEYNARTLPEEAAADDR